ncbi:MAG TPA: hypothetical protein VFI23_05395 [Rhizomicrobium sp.]|nr:hypothetical protein [Rhizomicrobium sp.]
MSVYSPEYHAMLLSPGPAGGKTPSVNPGSATPNAVSSSDAQPAQPHESFFHHLLDVINPLQHLPIIGTIYRAITGEHIGPVEKIAGDTLYGGIWGAVSSIADVAFEGITGKSFEDTALALFKGDGGTRVASAKVTAPAITANPSLPSSDLPALPSASVVAANLPDGPDIAALTSALSARNVDGDTATRALYAYRRSMGIAAPLPVLASVH